MEQEIAQRINDDAGLILMWYEEGEPKTYHIGRKLREMDALLDRNVDDEPSTWAYAYAVYRFIGEHYEKIGRFSLAAEAFEHALDFGLKIYDSPGGKAPEHIEDVLYSVIKDRNFYVTDDADDVVDKVRGTGIIEWTVIEKIQDSVLHHRRSLKHDPVEMSDEYLRCIDEVEEEIDKDRTVFGMGSCHEVWALKKRYLAKRGITWRSPAELNPGVRFD